MCKLSLTILCLFSGDQKIQIFGSDESTLNLSNLCTYYISSGRHALCEEQKQDGDVSRKIMPMECNIKIFHNVYIIFVAYVVILFFILKEEVTLFGADCFKLFCT